MVNYWVVRMTCKADDGIHYDFQIAEKNSFVGICWNVIAKSMDWISDESREKLKEKLRAAYPEEKERTLANWAGQNIRFVCEMQIGDIVILPIHEVENGSYYVGAEYYKVGKIKSDYYFIENPDDKCSCWHRRDVEWFKVVQELPEPLKSNASRGTINNINKYEELIEAVISGKILKLHK